VVKRARLYWRVRTAHLERAAELPEATVYFAGKRYDFDSALADAVDLRPAAGWRAAFFLWRDSPDEVEVNEPLMLASALWTATALAALDLRGRLRGRRARVVSYAIENRDPLADRPAGARARLRRRLTAAAARRIWRRLDRIAYGTAAAEQLYVRTFGAGPAEARLIEALPCPAGRTVEKDPGTVLFAAAFAPRKGIDVLVAAWPQVTRQHPGARLVLIGKGPLLGLVEDAAREQPSIEVHVAPPRAVVHSSLERASVLVLPSRESPDWREQVGLPIVEGLANGCTVVTTDQTGLASWLAEHGHTVLAEPADADALGRAISDALQHPLEPAAVRRSLPDRDGRLAADDWLFGRS
jgi:glycosyltransferase involved in cell wall biosynthesis